MTQNPKNLSLSQAASAEDHAAKILREKIGDVHTLGHARGIGVPPMFPAASATGTPPTPSPDQAALEQKIIEALQTVYDPEIPLNIYDLGLIYRLTLDPTNAVQIDMTLTAPGCPVAGDILASVKQKVEALPEVPKVTVTLVWDPPWTRDRLSEAARLELGM